MTDKTNEGYSKYVQKDLRNIEKTRMEPSKSELYTEGGLGGGAVNEVGIGAIAKDLISLGERKVLKRLSRRFLEVRFKPSAAILDVRGEIAEALSSEPFNSWAVSSNRVDFKNKQDKHVGGYFSFVNFGMGLRRSAPSEEFEEKARAFVRNAWSFMSGVSVTRIGMRSVYLSEVEDFEGAFRKYLARFLKLSEEELGAFGGKLVDVGFPLNFKKGNRCFNVMTGPMERSQATELLSGDEELPKVSIFVDVDYFEGDIKHVVRQRDVFDLITKGIASGDEVNRVIVGWVS